MNFRLKYLVYPVRRACKVTILPQFPVKVDPESQYTLRVLPFSGLKLYGLRDTPQAPTQKDAERFDTELPLEKADGALTLEMEFPQEDRYLLTLSIDGQTAQEMQLFALNADLFPLTPFKGDNHMHSCMSDGRESPTYVAAACCKRGYDYCVLTDHYHYEPSIQARDFYAATPVDFLVIPGEEIHSPDNPVHIINLGGRESVNTWYREHEDEYRAAVEKELAAMGDVPMLPEDKYAAAASQVIFDKVKSVDGVAVLCHPHWIRSYGLHEKEDVTDYLFDHRRFDVLELIAGGAYEVGTQLQLSYYHDRSTMPIVGSSDAHGQFGVKLEPGNFTIVFAEKLTAESIRESIRMGRAVGGNGNKLYGDYRLLRYAYFLMDNYYPAHKDARYALGNSMLRLASSGEGPDSERAQKLASPRPSELFAPLRYAE